MSDDDYVRYLFLRSKLFYGKEKFCNAPDVIKTMIETADTKNNKRILSFSVLTILIIAGTICVYFSWRSNSLLGWSKPWKIFFACGAFLFPYFYVAIHVFGKLDMIHYINTKCKLK